MIQSMGTVAPRLFFVNEGGEPYYFKEELVLPEEVIDPGSYDDRSRDEARRAGMIKIARNGAKIAAHRTFSSRILATSRLAKDLGIGDMVADTRPAKLVIDGVECSGTAMPAIGGAIHSEYVEVPYMRGYRAHYTANALRQLMILAIFDLVCGQIDRNAKNIKLFCDIDLGNIRRLQENEESDFYITHICAIDHDLSFGELTYERIREKVAAGLCISPELLGEIQYPAVDMDFCRRLFAIDGEDFRSRYSDLLTGPEIDAFLDRVDGLKRAIDRQRMLEDEKRAAGEDYFPRLIEDEELYEELLSRMEEAARADRSGKELRYSWRPTYLKVDFLRHEPMPGR